MLDVLNRKQSPRWVDLVKSFPHFDVNYLPQYTQPFALHGDGEPCLFYYQSESLRAANVVMRRDIADDHRFRGNIKPGIYFDLTTPYGYGGWIFDGDPSVESINILDSVYQQYCINEGIISEFVRFHPLFGFDRVCSSFYEIVNHGPVICMDLTDQDVILGNMDRKKRNIIRKAVKQDTAVECGFDENLFAEFLSIYRETMLNARADPYYFFDEDFFQCIFMSLKDNALIFYATKNGEIVAVALVLLSGNKMNYHLSGSKLAYRSAEPGSLLLYQTAIWGSQNGYRTLLLGGGLGSSEDSLLRFKKGFNRNSNYMFTTGRKIFNIEIYNQLCNIRHENGVRIDNSTFFPEYRR